MGFGRRASPFLIPRCCPLIPLAGRRINWLLFDSAEIANFTPEEKAKYEQNMTTERDIRNQISYARDLGREEGRAEGREEGREEGRKVGAREQSLLIARNLLKAGIPVDVFVRVTGLSPEEVQG